MTSIDGRLRAVVVGAAGHQGRQHIQTLRRLQAIVDVCALVDVRRREAAEVAARFQIPCFGSVSEAIANTAFDVAIVAAPHHAHYDLTTELLCSGSHVIKEKPLAANSKEAADLVRLARTRSLGLFVIAQRSYRLPFLFAKEKLQSIGVPYSFTYEYCKSFTEPTGGWRATRRLSCGGVVLDMGYHIIDAVVRLFGSPARVAAETSYCYPQTLSESLEDSASIVLGYAPRDLQGCITLSRHHYCEREELEIVGSGGVIVMEPHQCAIYSRGGRLAERRMSAAGEDESKVAMFRDYLLGLENAHYSEEETRIHLCSMDIIERVYQICSARSYLPTGVAL